MAITRLRPSPHPKQRFKKKKKRERHSEQAGKPQSLPSLSIGFFLFREIVGEVSKPGELARSKAPQCVRACVQWEEAWST